MLYAAQHMRLEVEDMGKGVGCIGKGSVWMGVGGGGGGREHKTGV